ncbi:hypothetical protein L5515_000126 [Caenorhabditis briggsae]|uniref:Sushi domain-containing protein n=1 Tax=Caenorhabditis briggsae TaxID=6238 RepID=A0AAE9DZ26_CAEBR|nr:hypothetical protein L5515_000126 [Caenorhabditis briggsae]
MRNHNNYSFRWGPLLTLILTFLSSGAHGSEQCGSDLKPQKLVVVGVWKRSFDNSTAQYRISDEDLSVRGYERANTDKATSTVMLARHPESCIVHECGVRLSAMMQVNGAILHTDHRSIRMNDSTMDNIEDEFYCADKSGFCGADVPIYRLVQHSLNGPHYSYSFDNVGQSQPGYEKEFFPLCYAWRQTPSVVLFNSSDNGVCLKIPDVENGKIEYSNNQLNVFSIGTSATLRCDSGFVGNGTNNLLCTKDGWYPRQEMMGNCVSQETSKKPLRLVVASDVVNPEATCPISTTPNGNVVYSANVAASTSKTSVPSATRATVLCNLGFVPTTSVTSSTCVDGEWIPALPQCLSLLDLKCPILSAPRNGELVFTNSPKPPYSLDSTISLKCARNFFGMGNLTAKCTSSGWDQKIGRCEPVGIRKMASAESLTKNRVKRQLSTGTPCSAIASPANGNLLYVQSSLSQNYASGTSAYLMCSLGTSLSGSVSTMCTNGQWSPAIGQCTSAPTLGQTTGNCAAIPNPVNGTVTYTSGLGTYTSGTIATLTCNFMSTVSGSATSTCLSGIWNPAMGTCTASGTGGVGTGTTCPNPVVMNGNITYSQGNPLDTTRPALTTAMLNCNSGYTLTGNTIATCISGTFTPSLGTCTLGSSGGTGTTCSTPFIMNGIVTFSQGNTWDLTRPSGTTGTLSCNSGYSVTGNTQATCTNGVFTPTLGTCNLGTGTGGVGTGTTCPNPVVINGVITYSQGNPLDVTRPMLTTASLRCNNGYTLSGNSLATCISGAFTPSLGTCTLGTSGGTGTTCITPFIMNGVVTFSQGNTWDLTRPSGTTGTLSCNSGYSVTGNSQATCTNGVFTPALGTCNLGTGTGGVGTGTTCPNPVVINGNITYSQGNPLDTTRPALTTAMLNCNSGYTLTGNTIATCISGTFTPSLGTCTLGTSGGTGTTCSTPFIMNGIVTFSQGNTWDLTRPSGTTGTLSCNSGYSVTGNTQATCTNGVFTPTLGTCNLGTGTGGVGTGTTCPNPVVTNGNITYSQGNPLDTTRPALTTAMLYCNNGFTLTGNSIATCISGTFTPSLGTCTLGSSGGTGTTCSTPFIMNGIVTFSQGNTWDLTRPSGTTGTLSCNSGYSVTGNTQATCTNGVFTPTLGTCNLGTGTGGVGTMQCTAMIAPIGGNVTYSNGGQIGPFPSGTTVTGSCTNGGAVQGASSAQCSNGMWSPMFLGTCSLIGGSTTGQCSAPTLPAGAQATYVPFSLSTTSYTSGTVATVTCTSGGSSLGSTTCTNGLWSPAITGICSGTGTGTTCPALTRPVGESVTYDGQTSFATTFNTGVIARVTCTNGTQIGQASCLGGQWIPAITATCSGSSTAIGTQCIGVIAPANSQVRYSDGDMVLHASGATVTLTCLNSATVTGNTISTCTNGAWTPTLGTCSSSGTSTGPCYTPPLTPTGATLTYSSGFFAPWTAGSTATMSCPSGQTAQGTTVTYCTNAAWAPALGTCSGSGTGLGQGCTPLSAFSGTLTNGRMSYTPQITATIPLGTVVNIVCYSGYSLSGNSIATCTSSGWSPSSVGSCVQQGTSNPTGTTCPAMPVPSFSVLSYSQFGPGPYPTGTTVMLQCDTNYLAVIGGATSATCQSNGLWYPSTLATCQRALKEILGAECLAGIAPVLGATMTYSNGQALGPYPSATLATATCQAGYVPNGIMTSSCTNGVWTPASLGICELTGNELGGTTCGRLGDPLSGTLVYSALGLGPYPSGTSATVLCNIGTTLSGSPSALCTNGVWNPLPGTCVAALLKRPPAKGVPKGVETEQSVTPASDVPKEAKNETSVVRGDLVLSGEKCPPPIAPAFGEITYSGFSSKGTFDDGTTAALKCNLGYKPTGPSFSTCRKGSFRPIIGKCSNGSENGLPGVCVPLSPPKNARIVYIQSGSSLDFEDGTTGLLYCEEGYAVTGVATLQCQNGQWEPQSGFGMCDTI